MDTRHIGSLEVSTVGLGCNNFGWHIEESASQKVVDAALDAGITHFDTAESYGEGASVQEVVSAIVRVTGRALPTEPAPRRAGDPPQLIADDAKIRTVLGWTPRFDDLDIIVRSAVDWEAKAAAR